MFLHLSVSHSVHRGEYLGRYPPGPGISPPQDQVHPLGPGTPPQSSACWEIWAVRILLECILVILMVDLISSRKITAAHLSQHHFKHIHQMALHTYSVIIWQNYESGFIIVLSKWLLCVARYIQGLCLGGLVTKIKTLWHETWRPKDDKIDFLAYFSTTNWQGIWDLPGT